MATNKFTAIYGFSWPADELRGQAVYCHYGQYVIPQSVSVSTDVEGAGSKRAEALFPDALQSRTQSH